MENQRQTAVVLSTFETINGFILCDKNILKQLDVKRNDEAPLNICC